MGNVNFGVDQKKTLDLAQCYGLRVFVETGTWKGGTSSWATEYFKRVITIEGDRHRFEKTTMGLAGKYPNLEFRFGDSRTELARVLTVVLEPCLIWLDAHWCGGGAKEAYDLNDECPLREEIAAINASRFAAQHVVMIDDARLFTAPPPYPHDPAQWPTVETITSLLAPRRVTIENDVIYAEPTS